ncbi:unnamed protein product, partial [Rotaria sordida]
MAEAFDITDSNTTMTYVIRFGTSNKIVHLTQQQQQLNRIPYLINLMIHRSKYNCCVAITLR